MKLNHLNLTVSDVTAIAHVPARPSSGCGTWAGTTTWPFCRRQRHGAVLTSMKVGRETEVRYPVTFHIGFIQPSEERVNEINQRLRDDGSMCQRRRDKTAPGPSTSRRLVDSSSKCSADAVSPRRQRHVDDRNNPAGRDSGPTSIWADPLHEGPVPGHVTDEELLDVRARHLAGDGAAGIDPAETIAELRRWRQVVDDHASYDELVLWYEHDLFDQLNLIQLLSRIGQSRPWPGR